MIDKAHYRPDIDGLRALAILSVLVFHAFPQTMQGGFTGVDVFFVISGFVITQMILWEMSQHQFSFTTFFARRARRLLPALIIVVTSIWVIGWFNLLPEEYASLGRYMTASAAFGSNLLTYNEVSYFDAPALTKPLLHLWSLSVETQFYLILPLVLVFIARSNLFLMCLFVVSFILNIIVVHDHPSFAFYLPITRLWEFLPGVYIAISQFYKFLIPGIKYREIYAWIGFLFILLGDFIVKEQSFPGWWAILPVCGAFLIINAGPHTWFNRKILANHILVFIGLISYPLYLWHWPLIVIGRMSTHNQDPQFITWVAVVISVVFAWLTYRFIEKPIRKYKFSIKPMVTSLSAIAILGLTTIYFDGLPKRFPDDLNLIASKTNTKASFYGSYAPPTIGSEGNSLGPIVMTWGDSHADHLQPGLENLQKERSFRRVMLCSGTLGDQGSLLVPNQNGKEMINNLKPDLVIISAFWWQYKNRKELLTNALKFFQQIKIKRIIVVGPSPFWTDLSPRIKLYTAFKNDINHRIPERLIENPDDVNIENEIREIAQRFKVTYISPRELLCNEQGCLARLNSSPKELIQADTSHYTAAGSRFLINHFANIIIPS